MRPLALSVLALVAAFASGCDCSGSINSMGGPCADPATRPATCGQACSTTMPCPGAFYCSVANQCTADCDPGTGAGCPAPGVCMADGRCMRGDAGPNLHDGAPVDAPVICADVNVGARLVTPTVIMIVDQSGSMTSAFGTGDRWNVLRDSLMNQTDGFVYTLQGSVRFGLALFSARNNAAPPDDTGPAMGECPLITWVDPAVNNYDAMNAVYAPANPIDETPTGDAIDGVLTRYMSIPDPSTDPTIFILATDGEPDTCEEANPNPSPHGQEEALAATMRAYAAGIRTYAIAVAGPADVGDGLLRQIANVGQGRAPDFTPCDADTCYWRAGNDAGLRSALQTIIGGVVSCDLELHGRIDPLDQACAGTVRLVVPGQPDMILRCNDPNGWRATDPTHIQLQGDACDALLNTPNVNLSATFPCDIILI